MTGGADAKDLMARALRELQRAQQRIDELERGRREPIAIVGAACRLPGGVDSPAALWDFLRRGGDATGEIPDDRWDVERFFAPEPGTPGRIAPRRGAFLAAIDAFDAAFFAIPAKEAELMDPQQRLLLETCWHAMEDAGVAPGTARAAATGVFVGISTTDYAYHLVQQVPPDAVTAHCGTGTSFAVAAGRIAYCLDLHGPTLAIDTACSSSLTALHLACRSLRDRECDFALVAGVNVIASPLSGISFSHARMLSPGGRCRTFAAAADGYARGEGAIALVLARSREVAERRLTARAEILGSHMNQDGRSAGLTVPSGPAQTDVVRRALAAANIAPGEVDCIEAHGTGTPLGDPIELQALGAVFAPERPAGRPLHVASAKTNFGHLEAAAGLLGVLKAALQVQHGAIAPHLHCREPNPLVPWHELPFVVPQTAVPWPAAARRVAGVSSFGFSGTNAHVVVADAPPAPVAGPRPATLVLPLAAADGQALRDLAAAWERRVAAATDDELADLAWTAACGRSPLRARAVAAGRTRDELAAALRAVVPGAVVGTEPDATLAAAARAFAAGDRVDFAPLLAAHAGRCVPAPLHPFSRRRFWYEGPGRAAHGSVLLREVGEPVEPTPAPAGAWWPTGDLPAGVRAGLVGLGCRFVDDPAQATVVCCAPALPVTADGVGDAVTAFLEAAHTLAARAAPPRLCVLADVATLAGDVLHGSLRAAARALAAETPQLRVHVVAAAHDADPRATACALAATDDDELLVRGSTCTATRFAALAPAAAAAAEPMFSGTCLVTGGTGAIGRHLARWLLRRGAPRIVLASRTGAAVPADLAELARRLGASIAAHRLDTADAAAVRALVGELAAAEPPLRSIVHAAGERDDALLHDLTPERALRPLRGKLLGALHLHAACAEVPLRHFVAISSAAGWLGSAGQAAYAAANGGLDALCRARRATGLPALAIAFGPWRATGMAADPAAARRFASHGVRMLTPASALASVSLALASADAEPAVAAVDVDWPALAHTAGARVRRRLGALVPAALQALPADRAAALRALAPADAQARLLATVLHAFAELSGRDPAAIAADAPFAELGLDSLLAVDLRHRLQQATGVAVDLAAVLGARDAGALAAALGAALHAAAQAPAPTAGGADLLDYVEGLSDADVARLLRTPPGRGERP